MNASDSFQVVGDYAVFRPTGQVSLQEAAALVTAAITQARTQKIGKLLVVVTGLSGFPSPTITERFYLVQQWAAVGAGAVRLAMVAKPEMIDPQKFGALVAKGLGLTGDIFSSEAEALAWLQRGE